MKKLTCGNEPWIKEILPKPHTIMDLRSLHIDKIISQWDIQIWNRNQSTTAVPMVGPVLIWQASCLPWLDQSFNPALPPWQVTKLPTWISQVPQPTCFSSQVPDLAQCPPRSTHLVFHLAQQNREWERLQLGWRDQFALKLKLSNPRRCPPYKCGPFTSPFDIWISASPNHPCISRCFPLYCHWPTKQMTFGHPKIYVLSLWRSNLVLAVLPMLLPTPKHALVIPLYFDDTCPACNWDVCVVSCGARSWSPEISLLLLVKYISRVFVMFSLEEYFHFVIWH